MANSPTDILVTLQSAVVAFNNLLKIISTVSTTSSGITTIRLTTSST